MKCYQCRRGIAKNEERRAKIVMERGKLKAAYHVNCWATAQRIEMMKATNRMPKNAYEVTGNNQDDQAAKERLEEAQLRLQKLQSVGDSAEVVLASRQVELAEQALQEARSEGWDDYRDPGTMEV